jgi:hypothetical protein
LKLLLIVSSLDLTQAFSATPAWWQLLKGLQEVGVDTLVTTYQGPAIESPWWRSLPNPVEREGRAFLSARNSLARVRGERRAAVGTRHPEPDALSMTERIQLMAVQGLLARKWRGFFDDILVAEPDIDAVIVVTAPANHLKGIPAYIHETYGKPVIYYDGDVPASLPSFAGFASGFRIYQGADIAEWAGFISNSAGGADELLAMGARRVDTLHYGADPDLFAPLNVPQDLDGFFYGHTREYREDWLEAMIKVPSTELPDRTFAVRGKGLGDIGRAQQLPYLSFSKLREYVCRSRLNLCVTRQAHASTLASSTSRPFELAALGACIVSNPYLGVETWFEPEREIIVVHSAEEAVERYEWLLTHHTQRESIGQAARARLLGEHTFRHRAAQLRNIVASYL